MVSVEILTKRYNFIFGTIKWRHLLFIIMGIIIFGFLISLVIYYIVQRGEMKLKDAIEWVFYMLGFFIVIPVLSNTNNILSKINNKLKGSE